MLEAPAEPPGLSNHSLSSAGIWLLFGKAGGPKPRKAGEAIEKALCFGWIDGQWAASNLPAGAAALPCQTLRQGRLNCYIKIVTKSKIFKKNTCFLNAYGVV